MKNISSEISLLDVFKILSTKRFVDMTHSFSEDIPHWPGFPSAKVETIYHYEDGAGTLGSGFLAHMYSHVGQWGTHVDPPAHFIPNTRTLDELDVKEMICPLAVLDVHQKAKENPDYAALPEDLYDWERRNGRMPEGAFVALRTDWFKRWNDHEAFYNKDKNGVPHAPGWGIELLKILCEDRKVRAIGHETCDTDPSHVGSLPCETYVLSQNIYQIEVLTNTDQLPEYGALIVASWPKIHKGSGFPARVFAILP